MGGCKYNIYNMSTRIQNLGWRFNENEYRIDNDLKAFNSYNKETKKIAIAQKREKEKFYPKMKSILIHIKIRLASATSSYGFYEQSNQLNTASVFIPWTIRLLL